MIPAKRNEGWLPEMFRDFFDNNWMLKANATAPAINVIENDKDYKVEVAAPGMTKDDFKVTLDDANNLLIEMEKKSETSAEDKKDRKFLRREFSYSKFEQGILLPDNVEKDRISAKVENGVLTIEIPKKASEEAAKVAKTIEVK
ncbi:MAG TPA: Hsp20/alpha crystallin family protein [Candidatus Bacteroides intestinavium]|uniref:Hsp20/alpha crystallin family protein n=2 Tax=Bacteroides TaxID=816 RepID=A0A9D2HNR3_9BACE|nr:Hsp20/alpha crystallin family protein [Candidatus Bacteroides merdipullorum]HJA82615.1 Hsp20/alpha crystallin family protein [Candidatus Bacteroides intestinavium]